jgi:hypothetical protein
MSALQGIAGETKPARTLTAAAVLIAAVLVVWAVYGLRVVRAEAHELDWLKANGARSSAKVLEVGWADNRGVPKTVWVAGPAGQECFVDLTQSDLGGREVGKEIAVVLDPRQRGACEGVAADMLDEGFGAEYARKLVPPVALLAVTAVTLVVARRRLRSTG